VEKAAGIGDGGIKVECSLTIEACPSLVNTLSCSVNKKLVDYLKPISIL
jgi:hypothetical protein